MNETPTTAASETATPRAWRSARPGAVAAIVALAGPPVGFIGSVVLSLFDKLPLPSDLTIASLLGGLALGSFFSYFFGLVPAVLTGIYLGWRVRDGRRISPVEGALAGFVFASAWVYFISRNPSGIHEAPGVSPFSAMAVAGAISGLICALLIRWWQVRRVR